MHHRRPWLSGLLALALLLGSLTTLRPAAAQGQVERLSGAGARLVLYDTGQDLPSYVAPPARSALQAQAASITVEYVGFSPEARAAFQTAVDIWQGLLVTRVPIRIVATWKPLEQGVLGSASPDSFFRNFNGAPTTGVWYPSALANQFAGSDLDPEGPDIDAEFNSTQDNWYLGSGQTPAGRSNFTSVVLHEIGHGLGFTGSAKVQDGVGSWGLRTSPIAYDRFVVNGKGANVLDTGRFPNPSAELAAQLQGGNLFFAGPKAVAANGGLPPRLYAPNPWEQGSSYSHLDEATYPAGNANALMTPGLNRGETNYNPGPLALAILADLGWTIASGPPPNPQDDPKPGDCTTFPETGKQVCGRFLAYWRANGGLAQQGLPLTNEFDEVNPTDGKTYKTQYFERARFEYHPEIADPRFQVLLGLLGREQLLVKYGQTPPAAGQPLPGECAAFAETGKQVCGRFLQYWRDNGGLAQQGLPLTPIFMEVNPTDGKTYATQYFERARFEWHPEIADQKFQVLLGLLGREQLFAKYKNGDPAQGPATPASPAPQPSPSPSPGGNVIFQDDFSNPNSGWPVINDPQGRYSAAYLPNEYRVTLAAANFYAILPNRTVPPTTNVRLEADMTRFGPVQEPLFGLACRAADPNNFYGALIDTQGYAAIYKFRDGRAILLGRVENTAAIRRGNATNRVRFDCTGTTLTLYANGAALVSAQDGDFGSGAFAILAFAFDKGGLDLHVRNFVASRP